MMSPRVVQYATCKTVHGSPERYKMVLLLFRSLLKQLPSCISFYLVAPLNSFQVKAEYTCKYVILT